MVKILSSIEEFSDVFSRKYYVNVENVQTEKQCCYGQYQWPLFSLYTDCNLQLALWMFRHVYYI